ncbi:MAG: hypothetical protein ABJF10_29630 [Chthoniobacter sp.]|uniref:hypothetical protein n=1 Tax=Chthoniobacter sp. TaxID=2510640 RepID=UPI0032A764E5
MNKWRGCRCVLVVVILCAGFLPARADDQVLLRKQFLDVFAKAELGQGVSKLTLPKGWTKKALIQTIDVQTGIWRVGMEKGTTVFRIYPYYSEREAGGSVAYACLVVKVADPSVTRKQLIEAFEGQRRSRPLRTKEYE